MKIRIVLFCTLTLAGGFFAFVSRAEFIRTMVFPVNGTHSFRDDFGEPRSGGRMHEGVDIIAKKHTPVVAVVDGSIVSAPDEEPSYGYTLVLRDEEGYSYHYLHLNNDTPGTDDGQGGIANAYAPGIERGVTVKAGQHIGYVGDSGNAESVGAHLHFELRTPDRTAISPYASLFAATKPGEPVPQKTIIEIPLNGVLVKSHASPGVYLVANDVKYLIANMETLSTLGFSSNDITIVVDTSIYRSGLPIAGGPNVIFMRDGKPITITPPTIQNFTFTSLLQLGSRSDEVTQLQTLLKRLGYYTYPTITGYFGTATRDAVIRFQKAHGIAAVGYVGPQTRAALNSLP